MAQKKSVRKVSAKKPLKSKTASKRKTAVKKNKTKPTSKPAATKKKVKSVSRSKVTSTTKKPQAVAKPTTKKSIPAKSASVKKKVVSKGTVSKNTKTITKKAAVKAVSQAKIKKSETQKPVPQRKKKATIQHSPAPKKVVAKKTTSKKTKATIKKTVVKSVSRPKNPTTPEPAVQKKTPSVAKAKAKAGQTRRPLLKSVTSATSAPQHVPKSQEPLLSSIERYNLGGLFACAIERTLDPDSTRLRAVLRHLGLSSQEKDNLIRLSQGFMIPKLFAESVAGQNVGLLLADLVKFGLAQGSYEKHWREEIRQVGLWLGFFPKQVEQIEQRVRR